MVNLIEIQKISKTYKKSDGSDNTVFSDFSLTISGDHHLVCITGADGAGKSTLLKILSGLSKVDIGSVSLLAKKPSTLDLKFNKNLGYMSQSLGLYLELTVFENLCLISGLKDFDLKKEKDKLFSLLKKVDLYRFKDYKAGALSGGMKQKLALTCALACEPLVLILDEPTVGVDPVSRKELWDIIFAYIKEKNSYCIFSSAYLEEAALSDFVLILENGRIVKSGKPQDLVKSCVNRTFAVIFKGLNVQHYARLMMFATVLYDKNSPIMDVCPRTGRIEVLLKSGEDKLFLRQYLEKIFSEVKDKIFIEDRDSILEDIYIDLSFRQDLNMPKISFDLLKKNTQYKDKVIDVVGIKKVFGNFTAVERSDFYVKKGEIFGLLGPNGAGKTTTFRMICALLNPTLGHVYVNGYDLRYAKSGARATIGYVSQKFSLYRKLSCRQNLEYFGRSYGLYGENLKKRIEELLDEFSLRKFASTKAESLPFGIQRQLSISCALIHKPKILFLDEATSGADPMARRNFWNRVNALCVTGTSIVVTTHFMEEAEYCDRFLIQDRGKILVLGSPDEICMCNGQRVSVKEAFISKVNSYREHMKEEV